MTWLETFLAILTGVVLRLAIPLAFTALIIYFLRKLDARWQTEAETLAQLPVVEKPECWNIMNCTEEERAHCQALNAPQPCWQVNRRPNGYLAEKCIGCEVFRTAPVPVHA